MNGPTTTALAPWFGSNRTLGHKVGEALRGCRWVGIPFGGGMPEVLHISAPTIVVGDVHKHVMNLAMVAADAKLGPRLYRELRRLPFHPGTLRAGQAASATYEYLGGPDALLDDEQRLHAAKWYFVAVWMGRSANAGTEREFSGGLPVRWNAKGGDSNTRYRSAVKSLVAWRRVFERCNFLCQDCFEFLDNVHDEPEHGVYCDPPFPGAGDQYKHKFTPAQHRRLAERLAQFRKARIVCRFYDHPMIRTLYPEDQWEWHGSVGRKQSNAKVHEVLLLRRHDREVHGKDA